MVRKWGSNENIRIGDIFTYDDFIRNYDSFRREYYQVVALRGRTQVVLRAIRSETYINEDIAEGSPLFWRRERSRPLPGQFIDEDKEWPVHSCWKGDKEIIDNWQTVTAWVRPCLAYGERPMLREISEFSRKTGIVFEYILELPEDWEPWDAEKIQVMEEYERKQDEDRAHAIQKYREEPWDAEKSRKLEEYERQRDEVYARRLKGETDIPWPEYPV